MEKQLRAILNQFGEDAVSRAMRNLGAMQNVREGSKMRRRRQVASGKLKNSLGYKLKTGISGLSVQFGYTDAAVKDYGDVIEEGRRPGSKRPPVAPIIEWMRIKNIRLRNKDGGFIKTTKEGIERAAEHISWAIGKRGIQGIHYFEEAVTDAVRDMIADETIRKALVDYFNLIAVEIQRGFDNPNKKVTNI